MNLRLHTTAAIIGCSTLGVFAPALHAGVAASDAERGIPRVNAIRELSLSGVTETMESLPAVMIGALPRLPHDAFGTAITMPGAMSSGYTTVVAALAAGAMSQGVRITTAHGASGGVNVATNVWHRDDEPGPGVDALINAQFVAYSIELSQNLVDNRPCTFRVIAPDEAGFTPEQTLHFRRLWAEYQPLVDNADKSAAFQVAVWEVAFDSGLDVSRGAFAVDSPSRVGALAQAWLDDVSSEDYEGSNAPVMVLFSETGMDMLTAIPMQVDVTSGGFGGGGGGPHRAPGAVGGDYRGGGGTAASGGGGGGGGSAGEPASIIPPAVASTTIDDGDDEEPPLIPGPSAIVMLALGALGRTRRRRA
jgi:MYXO-CTERM domain-containing protein